MPIGKEYQDFVRLGHVEISPQRVTAKGEEKGESGRKEPPPEKRITFHVGIGVSFSNGIPKRALQAIRLYFVRNNLDAWGSSIQRIHLDHGDAGRVVRAADDRRQPFRVNPA
jgi:hypothetical protein